MMIASLLLPAIVALKPAENAFPPIARIGKLTVGKDSIKDFRRVWGSGKTVLKGTPQEATVWTYENRVWVYATGYRGPREQPQKVRILVIKPINQLPVQYGAVPAVKDAGFSESAPINLNLFGMRQEEVWERLSRYHDRATEQNNGFDVVIATKLGESKVNGPENVWTVGIKFRTGTLSSLGIATG